MFWSFLFCIHFFKWAVSSIFEQGIFHPSRCSHDLHVLCSMTFRALSSPMRYNQWLGPLLDAIRHTALHQGSAHSARNHNFFGPTKEDRMTLQIAASLTLLAMTYKLFPLSVRCVFLSGLEPQQTLPAARTHRRHGCTRNRP